MKKLMIAMFVLVFPLLSNLAFAQRGGTPEERAERQTLIMKEELSLTEEQLPKVKELNLIYAQKGAELREQNRDEREAMMTAFKEMEKQKETELAQVLTDEQMTQLRKKKDEMRGERRGRN